MKRNEKRKLQAERDREAAMTRWCDLLNEAAKVIGQANAVAAYRSLVHGATVATVADELGVSKGTIQRLQLARIAEKAPGGFLVYYASRAAAGSDQ